MTATLHTIGYEGRTVVGMLEELTAAGVAVLVDVRELPLSRRRGFSKTALGQACRAAGIEYRHLRALGNPKAYRELYRVGAVHEGAGRFAEHLRENGGEALRSLADELATSACLLCVEEDHERCHREVIVNELAGLVPGLTVRHL